MTKTYFVIYQTDIYVYNSIKIYILYIYKIACSPPHQLRCTQTQWLPGWAWVGLGSVKAKATPTTTITPRPLPLDLPLLPLPPPAAAAPPHF